MVCLEQEVQQTWSSSEAGSTVNCFPDRSLTGYVMTSVSAMLVHEQHLEAWRYELIRKWIWNHIQVVVRNGVLLEASPPDYRELDYVPSEFRYMQPRTLSPAPSASPVSQNAVPNEQSKGTGSGAFPSLSYENFRQVLLVTHNHLFVQACIKS